MIDKRRKGFIVIKKDLIYDSNDLMFMILSKFIPTTIHTPDADTLIYFGISNEFDIVEDGVSSYQYTLEYTESSVKFKLYETRHQS